MAYCQRATFQRWQCLPVPVDGWLMRMSSMACRRTKLIYVEPKTQNSPKPVPNLFERHENPPMHFLPLCNPLLQVSVWNWHTFLADSECILLLHSAIPHIWLPDQQDRSRTVRPVCYSWVLWCMYFSTSELTHRNSFSLRWRSMSLRGEMIDKKGWPTGAFSCNRATALTHRMLSLSRRRECAHRKVGRPLAPVDLRKCCRPCVNAYGERLGLLGMPFLIKVLSHHSNHGRLYNAIQSCMTRSYLSQMASTVIGLRS